MEKNLILENVVIKLNEKFNNRSNLQFPHKPFSIEKKDHINHIIYFMDVVIFIEEPDDEYDHETLTFYLIENAKKILNDLNKMFE